jgi:hypothetical protein
MLYKLSPNVIWNKVGLEAEEALLIAENSNTQVYIVNGQTGVALLARLQTGLSLDDLAAEMQDMYECSKSQALAILQPFIQQLEAHGLVSAVETSNSMDSLSADSELAAWPTAYETPSLNRLEIDDIVDQELVALGSFQGGYSNTQGTWSCWGNQAAGVNDTSGSQPCRPGPGYGFVNGGLSSPTCSG